MSTRDMREYKKISKENNQELVESLKPDKGLKKWTMVMAIAIIFNLIVSIINLIVK